MTRMWPSQRRKGIRHKEVKVTPFMAGKAGDNRESDMRLPEHLRTKMTRLYADWDEVVAALRHKAITERTNITRKIADARKMFDELRMAILAGNAEVARLELYFREYVAEIRKSTQDGSVELVIVEARRECDEMIKGIINRIQDDQR